MAMGVEDDHLERICLWSCTSPVWLASSHGTYRGVLWGLPLESLILAYHFVKDILQGLLKKMFMEWKYLRSCITENIFPPFLYLINSLTRDCILSWKLFSFRILKKVFHCFGFVDVVEKLKAF